MNSLKRIAAAALSAALCFSMAVPAYADHYQTPKSIKGVLINEHAQIPDVLEVGASQVVLNFPMSWAFSSQLSVCQDLYTKLDQAGVTVTLIVLNDWAAASYSPSLLPVSQPTGASYYAFNTLNDAGVQFHKRCLQSASQRHSRIVSPTGSSATKSMTVRHGTISDRWISTPTVPTTRPDSAPGTTPSKVPTSWQTSIFRLTSAGTADRSRASSTALWT